MAYSKLHSSIVNSSLWVEPDATRLLFITLLALCDSDGMVYGSKYGLARQANIDADSINEAWGALMAPDPDSSDRIRAPENGGRRVEEVSGGFRLLNFAYYRGLRNDDERKEQNRAAQAKHRAKLAPVSQDKPQSAAVSHGKPLKAHTETEAEAEAEAEEKIADSPMRATPPPTSRKLFELGSNFDLPTEWGMDAEALGWRPADVLKESERFRQYWSAGKGSGTRRSVKGWRQAWSNWLSKAERINR